MICESDVCTIEKLGDNISIQFDRETPKRLSAVQKGWRRIYYQLLIYTTSFFFG